MSEIITSPQMDKLATLLEEGSRANEKSVFRFIEPASGTLRRATSKRHHIVFGRRGSGKTSLLKKAAANLTISRRPIAYVDLEPYKGNHYPDVLISVLIASLTSFKEWLDTAAVHPSTKKSFWEKLFGTVPEKPAFNRKGAQELADRMKKTVEELNRLLYQSDNAELQQRIQRNQESTDARGFSSDIELGSAAVTFQSERANTNISNSEIQENYRRSKIDFLYRKVIGYQDIFKTLTKLSSGDSFLFLDDLYHIPRDNQARLLDYFHRIAKGNDLWLKIGTIRHRSQWYVHGNPPTGLKIGDDADNIDLDLTLEKYALAKDFLANILKGLIEECSLPSIETFLAEGALDRLVLASGGVARDFLGIFRRSIDEARERLKRHPEHYRGEKIGAEDVNLAVGAYGNNTKQEEFKRDTLDDRRNLETAFERIRNFCTKQANANCFLLDQDASGHEVELIQELVDLRLIHLVNSRVTVSNRIGKVYKAFMLDVSQYAGERKRRNFKMIEFWQTSSRESLRRATLIYEP